MTPIVITVAIVLGLLVVAEVYARFGLGLGDPPLWLADPEIEYLPKPSKSYLRFGKRIAYNAWSMRSREFPLRKETPEELRVLLVGDSIVHGGVQTDQDDLATMLLERELAARRDGPVVVGNIGANSWGPPNWQAYLGRFGLFDADVVVLVVNSADAFDAPEFLPLGRRRPQRSPVLAIQELFEKYLPRYVRKMRRNLTDYERPETPEALEWCLRSFRETIEMVRAAGGVVIVAQHLKRAELATEPERGFHELGRAARAEGIEPVQLGDAFGRALASGSDPYRDVIHPNELGQRIIADALLEPILDAAVRE